jgi:transaldolase
MRLNDLKIRIFADGADLSGMVEFSLNPLIKGFTTNPTLMRKAGVNDYAAFAREVLHAIPGKPISFEVFADEFSEMEAQALEISSWGPQVIVKIPVTNTRGVSSVPLIRRLARSGVRMNVTALMTLEQVKVAAECLADGPSGYISLFAGRVADTGRDPLPMMAEAVCVLADRPHLELIWASPRELLNIFQANDIGCHVITVTNDLLKKLSLVGKSLVDYSLETVQMFHHDAVRAGYTLKASHVPPELDVRSTMKFVEKRSYVS